MRLTKSIKDTIVNAALVKAGIPDLLEDLRVKRASWAEAVRIDSFGGQEGADKVDTAIKKIKDITQTLPKGVTRSTLPVRVEAGMYINCGGISVRARFNGVFNYQSETPSVFKPCMEHTLKVGHPLVAEFHALEEAAAAISDKASLVRANVGAILSNVTTDTALLKMWPAAVELLPKEEATQAKVPAVLTSDINALLNLPSKD